jgi:hypothetical protein
MTYINIYNLQTKRILSVFFLKNKMKSILRIKAKKIILAEILIVATFAAVAAALLVAPAVQQKILPSAYAQTAAGSSAITEGACSTGSFADDFLASIAASCGPNSSGSAAGGVAICTGEDGGAALAVGGGTCSIGD